LLGTGVLSFLLVMVIAQLGFRLWMSGSGFLCSGCVAQMFQGRVGWFIQVPNPIPQSVRCEHNSLDLWRNGGACVVDLWRCVKSQRGAGVVFLRLPPHDEYSLV